MVDALLQLQLDLAIGLDPHGDDRALARADDAGDDRYGVTDDIVEKERLVRLIDEGRDMADIDRLLEIDELARVAQAVEKMPKILLHGRGPNSTVEISLFLANRAPRG